MRKIIAYALLLSLISLTVLSGCGDSNSDTETKSGTNETSVSESSTDSELPSDMEMKPSAYRNDKTGNWYTAAYAGKEVMSDYALPYYQAYFSSDDEIHFVWNATLGTVTRISVVLGELDVATYEYVDGEEHDADLACTGQKLGEIYVDMTTGETEAVE